MKLKTAIFSVAGALVILAGLLGSPTARADTKIGVVNFTQLLQESPALKAAMESLQAEFGPRREELIKMQRDVKAHPNNEHLRQDFVVQANEFQVRGIASRDAAVKKVENSLTQAIEAYANAEDFDLVISGNPVFVDPQLQASARTLDITAKVQAYLAKPSAQPVLAPDPGPTPPEVSVGIVRGLGPDARASVNIPRIQHYASEHGFAMVVLDKLLYAKPQFKVSDITTDARYELQQY